MRKVIKRKLLKAIDYAKWKLGKIEEKLIETKENHINNPVYDHYLSCYEDNWINAKCVFCLSTGRAGTMTLTHLLKLSKDIISQHEPEPRLIYTSMIAQQELSCLDSPDRTLLEKWKFICLAARDDYVFRANQKGKIYSETNNYLTYLSYGLKSAFPKAKFFHVHRHPYDFIISGLNRGYFTSTCKLGVYKGPSRKDPYFNHWDKFSVIEKCAWLWVRVNEDAINFCKTLNHDEYYRLKSEDLFSDINTSYKIFDFLEVSPPSEQEIKNCLSLRLNKQEHTYVSGLTPSDIEKIYNLIKPTADKLGYSI